MASALRASIAMRSFFLNKSRPFTSRASNLLNLPITSTIIPNGRAKTNPIMQRDNIRLPSLTSIRLNNTKTEATPEAEATATATTTISRPSLRVLEKVFSLFEDRCQRNETVVERDFVKTFDIFTRAFEGLDSAKDLPEDISNVTLYSAILLRCCGKLMVDTPPKGRELLAGNLWTFIKDKKIPIDISHYNNLIKVMNENETIFDPKKILDEISSANLTPDRVTYQRLIHQYCLQGDIQGATALLGEMKELGLELNEMTFASLIIGYGKQENPPAITEMFELMRSNNVEPSDKSYTAAFISLGGRLDKDPKAVEEFNKIYELMEKDEIQFSVPEAVDLITHLSCYKKSNETVAKLIENTSSVLLGTMNSRYRILSALIKVGQYEEASRLFWAQKVTDRALQTGSIGLYWIKALAKHQNVPVESILEECEKMREKGYNIKAFHHVYYSAAENGRLDLVRAALKKIVEEEPMKVNYAWPLIAQAKDENEIINTLKNELNPLMDPNDLLETFSLWVWPRFSNNIARLFEFNKELKYDNNMLMASFLNYSVQEDKISEAIKFISEASQDLVGDSMADKQQEVGEDEGAEPIISPRSTRSGDRRNLVTRLLNQIAEQTRDPELVKKAFNMCQLPSQQVSTRSLAALVKVHLLNNDFNSALEEFLKISREYRATPCRSELMQHCLVNKSPENLQKIMDVVTEIYGEQNALFDLAVSCLKTNKLKQAQKIFASPGFRVNPVRVYSTCRSIARQGTVNILENFVNLTRDMYDVNQESLYQVLLDTYERTSNAKRALHLWNMMQEEEFQPSKRSLVMIAEILEKNNIEVPFQKPRMRV